VTANSQRHSLVLGALLLAAALGAQLSPLHATVIGQTDAQAVEVGVREMLQRYSRALESLDAEAVRKIQPSIPVESLAKAFRDMRELKIAIDSARVLSVKGSTARVSFRVTQTLIPKVGPAQTTTVTRVMQVRRDGNLWLIEGFER
jgi:hypothetical protein